MNKNLAPSISNNPEHGHHRVDMAIRLGELATGTLMLLAPSSRGTELATKGMSIANTLRRSGREYARQTVDDIKNAAVEIGKSGIQAGGSYVLNQLGLEKQMDALTGKEKIRLGNSYKLGRLAVAAFAAPELEAARLAKGAYSEVQKTVRQDIHSHATTVRNNAKDRFLAA